MCKCPQENVIYEFVHDSLAGLYVASETVAFASDFSKWRLEIIKRLSFGDCVFFLHRQFCKAHYQVKNVFLTFFFFNKTSKVKLFKQYKV